MDTNIDKSKESRSLIISASNQCFTNCCGCYNHFSKREYPTAEMTDFIIRYCQYFGVNKITVGGGDPLARKDILKLLELLHNANLEISLDTTGLPFIKKVRASSSPYGYTSQIYAKPVVQLVKAIGIPLDGSTDSMIESFRPGIILTETKSVLETLRQANAVVSINTVVTKINSNDLVNIFHIIENYENIIKWQLFQYMPIGPRGYLNRTRFEISDTEFNDSIKAMQCEVKNTTISIEPKSKINRKNKYLLIDYSGYIWIPSQSTGASWVDNDSNDNRVVIGHCSEISISDIPLYYKGTE